MHGLGPEALGGGELTCIEGAEVEAEIIAFVHGSLTQPFRSSTPTPVARHRGSWRAAMTTESENASGNGDSLSSLDV